VVSRAAKTDQQLFHGGAGELGQILFDQGEPLIGGTICKSTASQYFSDTLVHVPRAAGGVCCGPGMATATARYTFHVNTAEIGPQLAVNWKAIIPRVEKTYGNAVLKLVAPKFKVGGTTWAQRLAGLRAAVKDCAPPRAVDRKKLYGPEVWLLGALLHEAGRGPHPGTSLLTVEVVPLTGGGVVLPLKSDAFPCKLFVARVLHDFAPDSELGRKLAPQLKAARRFPFDREFVGVIRSEYATKQKGTFAVLGATELLAPFAAGDGKDESYGI